MEVLDGWLADGCGCFGRSRRRELELVPTDDHEQELESRNRQHNEAQSNGHSDGLHGQNSTNAVETFTDEEQNLESADIVPTGRCCGSHEWIFRRWAMVLLCSGIVLAVKNNLGILVRHTCNNIWYESHRCIKLSDWHLFTHVLVHRWRFLEQSARPD